MMDHWKVKYDFDGNAASMVLDVNKLVREMVSLEEAAIREGVIRELRRQGYIVIPPEVDPDA